MTETEKAGTEQDLGTEQRPIIDVVVCSLDTPLSTEACLRSLFYFNPTVCLKVYLHICESCQGWARPLCQELGVNLVETPQREPHDSGMTRGYIETNSPYFLCLDSDIVFFSFGLLAEMVARMNGNDNLYCVGAEPKSPACYVAGVGQIADWGVSDFIICERFPVWFALLRRSPFLNGVVNKFGFRLGCQRKMPTGDYYDTGALVQEVMEAIGFRYDFVPGGNRFRHYGSLSWEPGKYEGFAATLREIIVRIKLLEGGGEVGEKPDFTMHNVRVDDGSQSMAWGGSTMETHPWLTSFLKLIKRFAPDCKTVVDLGCGEGGFAVEIARNGYTVTGAEARPENMKRCNWLKANTDLPDLNFVEMDVRNAASLGQFDTVLCCGLLYHMDAPETFLDTILPMARQLVIINTHYSDNNHPGNHNLSDMCIHDNSVGRWYNEPGIEDPLGSWGNNRSFWMTRGCIVRKLKSSGFTVVFEDYTLHGDDPDSNRVGIDGNENRCTIIGIRT